ncbi:SoxR reducing system RseC family protein [Desulfosoma caldarium]|uniref:RseC/MucC-like positive regulator of sigma(E) n=1 Tax=Desulfosoma caldarium TaxID=610254 RepID=A0A3N1UEE8_9BACT|nr:SoxR reducing system RseC family protein [Desulfosoma caldarium]ROQ89782.1 RseC/MucC-like positive regulator of sigma(E) [Desulfosoma caldarium]
MVRCATVLKVATGRAFVVVESGGLNCPTCSARGACTPPRSRQAKRPLEVLDPIGVRVGERVEILFPAKSLWTLSVLFFGLPAGAVLFGSVWASLVGWTSTAACVMSACAALGLALVLSTLIYRKINRGEEGFPTIVRIVTAMAPTLQDPRTPGRADGEFRSVSKMSP